MRWTHFKRGWLQHGIRMQIACRHSGHRESQLNIVRAAILGCCSAYCHLASANCSSPGVVGIGCHVFIVLKWQLNNVRAVILGCSHLLLIDATASARAMLLICLPHNAVHSSSIMVSTTLWLKPDTLGGSCALL